MNNTQPAFPNPLMGILCALTLTLALLSPRLQAAQINVEVLPDQVTLNESFQLKYTAIGSVDDDPDFSALDQDFEITNRQSSSSISIVNGEMSRTKTWTLQLMPRRKGNLVIPPVSFGKDISPARAIAVTDARQQQSSGRDPDIFVTAEVEPKNPYVQQQALLTVKLYRAVNINSASLSEPAAPSGDLVIEKLGEDRSYPANRSGRSYMVIERNYALLPQASGAIELDPIQFDGQVVSRSRFGFDPFGGGRRVRALSDPVTLNVRPVPASFSGDLWLPAANLSLSAHWSEPQPELHVGEPVTRVIRITAEGLAASQLPEIELPLPAGVRSYRDQPILTARSELGGIVAEREEKIALIPESPGVLRLPAIQIPWWNTQTDRPEVATLPAVEIAILPAAGSTAQNPITAPIAGSGSEQIATVGTVTPPVAPATTNRLPWLICGLLALGWLGSWWFWRNRYRQALDYRPADSTASPSLKGTVRQLKQACKQHDPRAASQALLAWGKLAFADQPPPSLESLALKLDAPLAEQVNSLARILYAPDSNSTSSSWNGDALANAFKQHTTLSKGSTTSRPPDRDPDLAPLNPG